MESFHNVTRIRFKDLEKRRKFTITDPNEVHRLVSLIPPERIEYSSLACKHTLAATFERSSGPAFTVGFCEDCFGSFKQLHQGFYKEYERLSRRHRRRVAVLYALLGLVGIILLTILGKAF